MDFRIGAPQLLLLKAALSPDKTEGAAALEEWWRDIADFNEVRGTDSALFPRIYWNVGSCIRDARLAARLKGAARHQWVKNQYMIAGAGDLVSRLAQAGVPALLMKGAAIAAAIDDDPGLRIMSDCDLLVPRDRALEVIEILVGAGLLEHVPVSPRDLDLIHGITLTRRDNRYAQFDIHWRPLRAVGTEQLAKEMFADARPVQFAGHAALAPSPEHLLLHAIVHGVEWSPDPRYEWLVDTVKILRRSGESFDWAKLAGIARRYRFGYVVGSALAEAAARTDLAVPGWIARDLRRPWAVLERLEAGIRLSKPSSRSTADEMLLTVQQLRRHSERSLRRPALAVVPRLVQSFYGPLMKSRSFIDNDQKERITFLRGWSAPGPTGRWTEGRHVSLAIFAPGQPRPAMLAIRSHPLPEHAIGRQKVDVFAGLRRLKTLTWPERSHGAHVHTVRLPSGIWRGDTAVLRFRIDRPMSPIEAGINGDPRVLGLFVQDIWVDPPMRDVVCNPLDLSSGGFIPAAMWRGWAKPEAEGCWTLGRRALLRWRASQPIGAGARVVIEIDAVAPGAKDLHGSISVNDAAGTPFRHRPGPSRFTVEVPVSGAIGAGEEVSVNLRIDNPRRPAHTLRNRDMRLLGLFVRRLWVAPPQRQS